MKVKRNKKGPDGYEDNDPSDPDFPSGDLIEIPNFLPPPDQLVFPDDETEKVTIILKKKSVDFFREQARKHHTKYQRMIRAVLDRYVKRFKGK